MRPFLPHLRLRSDAEGRRLVVESDVLRRSHAVVLAAGSAAVAAALAHSAALPQGAAAAVAGGTLAVAIVAWLALPSMTLRTFVASDGVEIRRRRRRAPEAVVRPGDVMSVRLGAPSRRRGAAPWRLSDRQVEIVTVARAHVIAITDAEPARALAQGLARALSAPLRDDTPEAECASCLQQALLAMGRIDAAAPPPEGTRLRASHVRGWLVVEIPGAASRGTVAALALTGIAISAGPMGHALDAPSPWLAAGLLAASLAWLAAATLWLLRTRSHVVAASPLGVRFTRFRAFGSGASVHLAPPVAAASRGGRIDLRSEGRVELRTGARDEDAAWMRDAIAELAGRPLPARTAAVSGEARAAERRASPRGA